MTDKGAGLLDDLPDYCRHAEADAPVPEWEQVTRSTAAPNPEMIAHVTRLLGGEDEAAARAVWDGWPGNYRRSVALLVDKIYHEGWLDQVERINGWPWDGGFFFIPRVTANGSLVEVLEAKSGAGGVYTECSLRNGLFAYLNAWSHKGWVRGWMENNAPLAALHVGVFENGSAEVHFDVFNSLYTNGAPEGDVTRIPLLGTYNHRLFALHKRWEISEWAARIRTSANFYHMLRGTVPLSF